MHRDTGLPGACINMLFFANNAMEVPASTAWIIPPLMWAHRLGLPTQIAHANTPPLTWFNLVPLNLL